MDDADITYELVYEAVKQALLDHEGGDVRILRRYQGGKVIFEDSLGRAGKEMPAEAVFKKITAVREKLRVVEQKINNNPSLDPADKADLQGAITRCYGSLTSFNFLFATDADRFKGTSG